MTTNFKYDPSHVRDGLTKLSRDARRSVNSSRPVRFFRCLKWKYQSNDTFRDVCDSFLVMMILGTICGVILAISIAQYFNDWL